MTRTRRLILPVVVATFSLLTACAGPSAQPTDGPTTGQSSENSGATAAATSKPSPSAALPSAPSSSSTPPPPSASASSPELAVVTTAGWGDLRLGEPVPTSTTLVTWKTVDPDQCMGNDGYWDLPNDPGAVLVRTKGNSRTGVIEGISLLDPSVTTKSGAHVGTSLAELKTLFPDAKVEKDGALYVVADSLGQVVFDVGNKNSDEYYPGPDAKDVVLVLHVLPTSTKPFSNQHTEFGPCA